MLGPRRTPLTILMFKRCLQSFSSSLQVQNIKNLNLRFQSDTYFIHLYPFYPQLYKKKQKNTFQISSYSKVLAMIFVNKSTQNSESNSWETRRSISLKFKQVGQIINVQPRSGQQVEIQSRQSRDSTNEKIKILKIKDIPDEQRVKISLNFRHPSSQSVSSLSKLAGAQNPKPSKIDSSLETFMPYSQYSVMYKLLDNSLLDLSGWKFMMEIQKKVQLSKIDNKSLFDQSQMAELLEN